jgi:adenylate cyclase
MAGGVSQTRQLAAILAAAVAGYSRLMGSDEARLMGSDEVGALHTLRAIRNELIDSALAAHHGRLMRRRVTDC